MNIISKVNNSYRENRIYYLMVLIFFCVGIALGTYMVKYMSSNDSLDLSNYFTSFMENIIQNSIEEKVLFIDVLKKGIILLAIIIILGFTIFGIPFILIIDLIKGFSLGYTFSFLLTTLNGKGIWLALASLLPQNIFYIPCFIAISIISIEFSSNKLQDKFFNKGKINRIVEKKVILKVGVFLCLFLIGVLIETFLCPNIIKYVIKKSL